MPTQDFDQYSVALHREAKRSQLKFPQLTYDRAVKLLDEKARTTQANYAESEPPLFGCLLPLNEKDIERAFVEGAI
jgi:hypothetical protein